MDNLYRDISRLDHISESALALESFSILTRMGDFTRYYFKRFFGNIFDVFKNFSHSEIQDFHKRYQIQIQRTLNDPLLNVDDLLVAVPKGMQKSYRETLSDIAIVLESVKSQSILTDLEELTQTLYHGQVKNLPKQDYTKASFDRDKTILSKLFSQVGLSQGLGKTYLESLSTVKDCDAYLVTITRDLYSKTLDIKSALENLERTHDTSNYQSTQDAVFVKDALLTMAYRLSTFAVCMDLLQRIEHSFVIMLGQLKTISANH